MADRESTLAIVISTVDRATAGLRKINSAINSLAILAAPISLVGERLGALAKEAGLPKIVAGFKGLGEPIEQLAKRMLVVGGAGVGAVLVLKHLVGEFDDLGDKAEALGVSADFLAQMRFAAERSGAEVEQLDSGIQTLSTNMGLLRANTGKMKKFLDQVSPALVTQLKATKSNEEAFLLLAKAMAKIKDPAKRAALSAKVFGEANLNPLLAKGADGIEELRKRFVELGGSQADAVEVAGAADDSLKDLGASIQGVKAALVAGLGPAFRQIVDELRAWITENRSRIAEWVKDFGKTLPDKIHRFAEAFIGALETAKKFVDSIGGLKTLALGAAAVLAGPLVKAFLSLSAAMLSTPFGQVLLGLGAMAALAISVRNEVEKTSKALDTSHEKLLEDRATMTDEEFNKAHPEMAGKAEEMRKKLAIFRGEAEGPFTFNVRRDFGPLLANPPPLAGPTETRLKVDFMNAPKGMRVTADRAPETDLVWNVGYQMGAPP